MARFSQDELLGFGKFVHRVTELFIDNFAVQSSSGGSLHATTAQGATATISFTGTGIWLMGSKGPNYGGFTIAVDGRAAQTGTAQQSTTAAGQLLGAVSGLPIGLHQVVLTSTGPALDFDSFIFESAVNGYGFFVLTIPRSLPVVNRSGHLSRTPPSMMRTHQFRMGHPQMTGARIQATGLSPIPCSTHIFISMRANRNPDYDHPVSLKPEGRPLLTVLTVMPLLSSVRCLQITPTTPLAWMANRKASMVAVTWTSCYIRRYVRPGRPIAMFLISTSLIC
jgi:hypothetical protein